MTAVLRSFVSNWPIMLGDLLLSGPEQQNPVHVPTVADITEIFPTGSGWAPAALQQKIAMLADNLVVGWAGNRLAAKILIADLWEKSNAEPCTLASLTDYFNSADPQIWAQGVRLTGFVQEPSRLGQFEYGTVGCPRTVLHTERFGEIVLLGSGAVQLHKLLDGLPQLTIKSGDSNFGLRLEFII